MLPKVFITAANCIYGSSLSYYRDSLSLINIISTSRALTLVFNWLTSYAILFNIFTKCGRRKSAPKVSLERFIRSFAVSAIISLLLLSYFKKQINIFSMFLIKHSSNELISNSIRSREISIILITVSLSSFKMI